MKLIFTKVINGNLNLKPQLIPYLGFSLEWGKMRPLAHEVHTRATNHTRPTRAIRFSRLGDDASAFIPCREFKDTKTLRPTNFQKWVKKFNGPSDPYDHLASFKQIA